MKVTEVLGRRTSISTRAHISQAPVRPACTFWTSLTDSREAWEAWGYGRIRHFWKLTIGNERGTHGKRTTMTRTIDDTNTYAHTHTPHIPLLSSLLQAGAEMVFCMKQLTILCLAISIYFFSIQHFLNHLLVSYKYFFYWAEGNF